MEPSKASRIKLLREEADRYILRASFLKQEAKVFEDSAKTRLKEIKELEHEYDQ